MKRVLGVGLLLAACSGGTTDEGEWQRRVGIIHPEFSSVQMLSMPTEVRAGTAFDVVVRTTGSSSCTRAAGLSAVVSGMRLDLTPYDEYAPAHLACTDDLHAFDHTARVTLHTVGTVIVRVHGRTAAGASLTDETELRVVP